MRARCAQIQVFALDVAGDQLQVQLFVARAACQREREAAMPCAQLEYARPPTAPQDGLHPAEEAAVGVEQVVHRVEMLEDAHPPLRSDAGIVEVLALGRVAPAGIEQRRPGLQAATVPRFQLDLATHVRQCPIC